MQSLVLFQTMYQQPVLYVGRRQSEPSAFFSKDYLLLSLIPFNSNEAHARCGKRVFVERLRGTALPIFIGQLSISFLELQNRGRMKKI